MSDTTVELRPCPICRNRPHRNGRAGVGGVICSGPDHRVQTYGDTQADADSAWNGDRFNPKETVSDE